MSTAKRPKPFFTSVKHPGLYMNKYGVVLADRSHEAAVKDLYPRDWERVPLDTGFLDLKDSVTDEAWDSGYRYTRLKDGERLYRKPERNRIIDGVELCFERRRYSNRTFTWVSAMIGGEWVSIGDPWPCMNPGLDELKRAIKVIQTTAEVS